MRVWLADRLPSRFAGAVGTPVPIGATYIYRLNFFAGFLVASGVYWVCNYFSPVPATSNTWLEIGDTVRNPSLAYGVGSDEEYATGMGKDGGKYPETHVSRCSSGDEKSL